MELNKKEKLLKNVSLLYAITFIITTIIFIFFSEELFKSINLISSFLFPELPMATDSGKFWLSMTVSMMIGVSITSFLIFKDVKKYHSMAIPLIAMKLTSASMGLAFFVAGVLLPETKWNTLANIIIPLCDAPIGLFMLILYSKTRD